MRVRDAEAGDEAEWRRLWAGYCRFYDCSLPDPVTAHTWARILDPAHPMLGRVVARDGAICGFSVSLIHDSTWTLAPVCYLEDLYVDETARGAGLGRALIEDLLALARVRGWSRLYWHTRSDNTAARGLYERFAAANDFVRYRIALRDRP